MRDSLVETAPRTERCTACGMPFCRTWKQTEHIEGSQRFVICWANCLSCHQLVIKLVAYKHNTTPSNAPLSIAPHPWTAVFSDFIWPPPKTEDIDPLTGLFRKSVFDTDALSFMRRALRAHQPLSLVLLDLDGFKAINDGPEGHQVGDSILSAVGPILKSLIAGKGDVRAYRWGGDEFTVLLPNYTVEEAVAFASRLLKALSQTPVGSPPRTVTASIGVAKSPGHGVAPETLFASAEEALHRAKSAGKNRVEVATPVLAEPAPFDIDEDIAF